MTTLSPCNDVRLVGRLSGLPTAREMPSGDELVQLRVVVPRSPDPSTARTQVDTIDIACWSPRTRAVASGLPDGAGVEVEGSLRRRFFATGGGRASRYEVEATSLRAVTLDVGSPEES